MMMSSVVHLVWERGGQGLGFAAFGLLTTRFGLGGVSWSFNFVCRWYSVARKKMKSSSLYEAYNYPKP